MSDDFDPYWAWLGIPPGIRPPSQADLLGVSAHETSPETIAQSADRRMAVVSAMLVTPHAAWAQRLLVEVATARAMLLAGLGSRAASASTPAPAAAMPSAAMPAVATPSAAAATGAAPSNTAPAADDDLLPPVATTDEAGGAPTSPGAAGYSHGLTPTGYPAQQPQYMPQPAAVGAYVPQAQPAGYAYPPNYAAQPAAGYGYAVPAMAQPTGYSHAAGYAQAAMGDGAPAAAAPSASVPGAGGYRSVASAARRRSRSSFNLTVIGGLAVVCVVIVAVILGQMGGDNTTPVGQAPVVPPTPPADTTPADVTEDPTSDEPAGDTSPAEAEPAPPRDPATIRPRVVRSPEAPPEDDPPPVTEPAEPMTDEPSGDPTGEMPADDVSEDDAPEDDPGAGDMPAETPDPAPGENGEDAPDPADPSEPTDLPGDEPNPTEPNPDDPAPDDPDMPAPEPEPTPDTPEPDEPSDTTTPEPMPEPEPDAPPPASGKEAQLVERALVAFRSNLESREFEAAAEKLDEALLEVTDPALSARLDRAQSCLYYVGEFWEAVSRAVAELQGGQELTLNGEIIIVVEVQPDLLIIRAAGMNRRYRIRQIPPALAYQLADTWLSDDNPTSQVFLAAFLALDGKGDPDRARTMLAAAARDGLESEVQPLLDALDGKL